MYWKTQKAGYANGLVSALMAALSARPAAALLATPTVVLFVSGPALSPTWSPASYIAPTFHGYAGQALTLVGPVNIGGTDLAMIGSVTFLATAGGTINDNVIGYAVVDTTLAIPYMIELFANPVGFANPGDFLELDIVLPFPQVYIPTIA